ncbi:MAG: hypothetical protein ACJ74Y_02000 [Bryobacteraceae bacterium]
MRFSFVFCVFAASLTCRIAAQEPPLPRAEVPTIADPAATPLPEPAPPQLIPDEILPAATPAATAPNLQELDEAFKDNPLTKAAADYRLRIEWRKLRNGVVNDPEVKAALATADAAKTDLQKRKLLRRYYELIYAKMLARAETPEMKAYLTARKTDHLAMLPQPRVRPEASPIAKSEGSAAPNASATPQPSATPVLKRRKGLFPTAMPGSQ